jgi:AcrR family transcriptional regulator
MKNTQFLSHGIFKRNKILEAALQLAIEQGYLNITRDKIAAHARVATGSVNYYFETVTNLRNEVMAEAIKREIYSIIAEGLSAGNLVSLSAPEELKNKAVRYLTLR